MLLKVGPDGKEEISDDMLRQGDMFVARFLRS